MALTVRQMSIKSAFKVKLHCRSLIIKNTHILTGAKNEYQTLKRELSQMSRKSTPSKVEEGQADTDDFNLDEFLHGIHREQEENGQKRKHLGVSWKNLHIEVNLADKIS